MRRFKDMSRLSGNGGENFPANYDVIINTNHPINVKLAKEKGDIANNKAKQVFDLALLSQGLLTGRDLSDFVNRSVQLLEN
jgi:molecular chaperone HtpG